MRGWQASIMETLSVTTAYDPCIRARRQGPKTSWRSVYSNNEQQHLNHPSLLPLLLELPRAQQYSLILALQLLCCYHPKELAAAFGSGVFSIFIHLLILSLYLLTATSNLLLISPHFPFYVSLSCVSKILPVSLHLCLSNDTSTPHLPLF